MNHAFGLHVVPSVSKQRFNKFVDNIRRHGNSNVGQKKSTWMMKKSHGAAAICHCIGECKRRRNMRNINITWMKLQSNVVVCC
jgi:hypothetical protein